VTTRRFLRSVAVAWRQLRRRVGWLDHLIRAGVRYDEADGGRLAAAVTYYAFFATFALGLLGFAIFGFVLDNPAVLRSVQHYVADNVPRLDVQTLRNARGTAGIIAFIGLPITGWFWVDVLRSSIRRIWRLPEQFRMARRCWLRAGPTFIDGRGRAWQSVYAGRRLDRARRTAQCRAGVEAARSAR
jgi:membrane protein